MLWNEIFEVFRMNNTKGAVIIIPHLTALDDRHPFISVYKNVAEVSENNGAVVLDLFPAVKGCHPPDLWIGLTDSHPNELAHRIFADEIYGFFKEENYTSLLDREQRIWQKINY